MTIKSQKSIQTPTANNRVSGTHVEEEFVDGGDFWRFAAGLEAPRRERVRRREHTAHGQQQNE